MDLERTVLIVTGAHPEAEVFDRPIAYGLRERIESRLATVGAEGGEGGEAPPVLVCSDVWYLNSEDLRQLPAISVGSPSHNALTAFLGDKLPSVFSVEGVMVVQADVDCVELLACCWGRDAAATASAVEAFSERYLGQFLEAACARWEAMGAE